MLEIWNALNHDNSDELETRVIHKNLSCFWCFSTVRLRLCFQSWVWKCV